VDRQLVATPQAARNSSSKDAGSGTILVGVRNSDHPYDLRRRPSWPPARDGESRPLEGPRGLAREPKVDRPESDALGSGRVAPMPSRAVRPQGKGTEALMPASVAPKRCCHAWAVALRSRRSST